MTTIWLEEGRERTSSLLPPPTLGRRLLDHQQRTWQALREHDLVVNTHDTGTGKTLASLLYLFDLEGKRKNVLFIAPTNALLAQHATDIQEFVAANGLDYRVRQATATDVRELRLAQAPDATPSRPGELLQRLIRNYLEFEPAGVRRQPIILVVNPDIFYYALYFRYGAHDRRNVFERFLTAFDYIVVDEFHYYDSKQVANFMFAFALFDQFGYFQVAERKVCLLSATPTDQILTYLDRLFSGRWGLVSPDSEPRASAGKEEVSTLAPLALTIVAGELEQWTDAHRLEIASWVLDANQQGAIISSSLWRINAAFASLRQVLAESRMGRITGPEPQDERLRATRRDLILATPTVDIGYNFAKMDKARQNVDFVICDARHGDELLQRIGRAGRLLGKSDTTQPSRAIALLGPEAAQALAAYDGQRLSRAEFAAAIAGCPELPPKHSLTAYVRTHAITESFWPIYQIGKVLPEADQGELEALFDRVREVFAPGSRRPKGGLYGFFHKLESRQRWLSETRRGLIPLSEYTAEHLADWLEWLEPERGRYEPSDLLPHLGQLLGDESQQHALQDFVRSQAAATEALFAFRDSFQGPSAVVYDPQHQFSSQTVAVYDLFHLLSYYRLSPLLTRRRFERLCGDTGARADFCVQLLGPRQPAWTLELVYESEDEVLDFQRKWCGAPVGLARIRLQVRERGGGVLAGALDQRLVEALADTPLPMLIIPPDSVGGMIARLRGSNLWARRLSVRFPDGREDDGYRAFLGTAAFHAHAELLGHFLMKDRLKPDAIII